MITNENLFQFENHVTLVQSTTLVNKVQSFKVCSQVYNCFFGEGKAPTMLSQHLFLQMEHFVTAVQNVIAYQYITSYLSLHLPQGTELDLDNLNCNSMTQAVIHGHLFKLFICSFTIALASVPQSNMTTAVGGEAIHYHHKEWHIFIIP